jgi:signal transduction histidine kinase
MTIRRLLLAAFLLLTFLATALLAGLSFFAAREALAAEIGRNLGKDAAILMEQVDMLLFERLQNVHSWSHLDIMQESRVGDVDKRLARFLADIRLGYGEMYRELFYVDRAGRVIASTEPGAIGRNRPPQTAWAGTSVPAGEVFLEPLSLAPPYATAELLIRAPVHDPYGGEDIGQLYGAFDLVRIFRLFDQAEQATAGTRFVALLDRDGRLIAASRSLRQKGLLLGSDFAAWRPGGADEAVPVRDGAPATDGEVLAGYARSQGYQGYPGLGWSLLVFQPAEQAFQPIRALLWLFCVAFLATGLVAGAAAHGVAGRIARPLVGLTAWARNFMCTVSPPPPKISGTREVRELGRAFGQMVDDLEQSRQQVIHAAKLAVVGEMAAIMAHEVRTPLGILHTSAQMLRREPNLSPEGQEMTQFMLDESARLGRLISTLLECAKPRPPAMKPGDVHAILRRVADLLAARARKKHIAIEWRLDAADAVIPCDEELLMQVFLNLVMNALQILPDGGRIGLRSARTDGRNLLIEVADDGPGIPPDARPRVFDPFYTAREGGIGLGLTVTRQIVEAHGGEISVGASEWGGACFRVMLPAGAEVAR